MMDKRDFISRIEKLISEYCRNNNEYEDVSDDFCFSHKGDFYNVRFEIDKEESDDE